MKKTLSILLSVLMIVSAFAALPFNANATTTIEKIAVRISPPEVGNGPNYSFLGDNDSYLGSGYNYTTLADDNQKVIHGVSWYDATDDKTLSYVDGDEYVKGHIYRVTFILNTKEGYEFKHDVKTPTVTATVNGETAKVAKYEDYASDLYVKVTYTFNVSHEHVGKGFVVTEEPTCTKQGKKENRCAICDDVIEWDFIPALGHKYELKEVTTAPTCTSEGKGNYECSVCHDKKEDTIAATGHKAVAVPAVPATFKAAGKTAGTKCSVCGTVLTAQKAVAKLGSPKISKLTKAKKAFTAKWKKVNGIDGYQVRYSLKKNMKSSKTVTVKKSATSKKVSKLKAKKTYYVQIRAYKTINGKKQYSAWSAKKTVKTK